MGGDKKSAKRLNNSNFEMAEPSFYGRGSPQQQSKTESCQEFGRSEKVEIVIDVKLNRLAEQMFSNNSAFLFSNMDKR